MKVIILTFIKRKRVERLQEFFKKRAGEMIRRDIKNVEKLEKLKEKERLGKERADANTVATFEFIEANFSSASDEWVFSPSLLRNLDIT